MSSVGSGSSLGSGIDLGFVNAFDTDSEEEEEEEEILEEGTPRPFQHLALGTAVDKLQRTGVVAWDDATRGTGFAEELRAEIELLFHSELLKPSCNRLATNSGTSFFITSGDFPARS